MGLAHPAMRRNAIARSMNGVIVFIHKRGENRLKLFLPP
jgi:hypothetical protein